MLTRYLGVRRQHGAQDLAPYLPSFSHPSPIHLRCISAASPLHLACISPASRLPQVSAANMALKMGDAASAVGEYEAALHLHSQHGGLFKPSVVAAVRTLTPHP